MAQNVSELWSTLWGSKNTEREYAFEINGVWYGKEAVVDHKAEGALYHDFGIGNATTSSLSLSLYADDIPRAAEIKRYIRLVNGTQETEWLQKGIFWANRRAEDDGYWTIEAFDAMRKADKVWEPDQSLVFPMPMDEAVAIIAAFMGVEIDPRTQLNASYTIDYPVSEQTLRKTLQWIAAAHGGNFIMTDEGKLLLVPLISAPAETNYLVTEYGAPIVIGGMKLLVDDAAGGIGNEDGAKHHVGRDIVGFANNGKYKPVSRVTLLLDDDTALTAGDDTGIEIVADCPYATQTIVNALLTQFDGYEYQSYEADSANLDPAAELGDGVMVYGLYSVIAHMVDDGKGYPSISAPGEAALDDEYPSGGPMQQEFTRKIAETRSLISKTSSEILLKVEGTDGKGGLTGKVAQIETSLKTGIKLEATDGTTSSTLKLSINGTEVASAEIKLTGVVTFEALGSAPGENATLIDGGWIAADTITAGSLEGDVVKLTNRDITHSEFELYKTELIPDNHRLRAVRWKSAITQIAATYDVSIVAGAEETDDELSEAVAALYVSESGWTSSKGDFEPWENGVYDLGESDYIWNDIYAANCSCCTSDRNKKNSINYDMSAYNRMFDSLKPVSYKLNSGKSGRKHIGLIAQDVEEALADSGLNSLDFAGFIKSPKKDEDGNIIEGEYTYALRYGEFISMNIWQIQQLKARMAELERRMTK